MSSTKPDILLLDIETAPITAYTWKLFDTTIGLNQIIDNGRILCVGAKWLGEKNVILVSEWDDGQSEMLSVIYEMICKADAVVTYNGDHFDLPKLQGAFLQAGFDPPPPITSIDVYKSVKRLGFISNKLAFVGPLLNLGKKVDTGGFDLWTGVLNGDKKSQNKMAKYCSQDVNLLEKLYLRIKPYIKNHPFIGERGSCGACDGKVLHSRGYRRTKSFRIQRLQCQTCGSWQDGKREKV